VVQSKVDDLCGVVDTVVPEPLVNKMSINRQGNTGINIRTVELMTSNSGDLIPKIIAVQSNANDQCGVLNMVAQEKQITYLEWLIWRYHSLQ